MKQGVAVKFGKLLMRLGGFRICIVDDEESYFNTRMLDAAEAVGFTGIERHFFIDLELFQDLHDDPRDVVILDVQGVVDSEIAKDGVYVASSLLRNTSSFVVITSAHQFHLQNKLLEVDYVIENRLLTTVDFIETLHHIVDLCMTQKIAAYKKLLFRTGYFLIKKTAVQ